MARLLLSNTLVQKCFYSNFIGSDNWGDPVIKDEARDWGGKGPDIPCPPIIMVEWQEPKLAAW